MGARVAIGHFSVMTSLSKKACDHVAFRQSAMDPSTADHSPDIASR